MPKTFAIFRFVCPPDLVQDLKFGSKNSVECVNVPTHSHTQKIINEILWYSVFHHLMAYLRRNAGKLRVVGKGGEIIHSFY